MGSAAPRDDAVPQQDALPSDTTRSAACPYFSFTISLMSSALMTGPPSAGAAAARRLGHGQAEAHGANGGRYLVLEIVVEVIDLPLGPVRIHHPELVLVGMAAVDRHLLAYRQSGRLDPVELAHHVGGAVQLDTQMVHWPGAGPAALGQGEVDRPPLGQELRVAGLLLHRLCAEEGAIEGAALVEVGDMHVDVDLGAHGVLLSSRR